MTYLFVLNGRRLGLAKSVDHLNYAIKKTQDVLFAEGCWEDMRSITKSPVLAPSGCSETCANPLS